jgi:hypothetical protein
VNQSANQSEHTAPPESVPKPPRVGSRRWYRLHWSTWIVIASVLAVLVLLNGPARVNNHGVFTHSPLFYEHGWPFVFLDRFDPPSSVYQFPDVDAFLKKVRGEQLFPWAEMRHKLEPLDGGEGPYWLNGDNWTFTGHWNICWIGLALNFATALSCVVILSAAYEVWSRRHWRYSLRSLLVSFLAFAAVMAWWRTAVNRVERESQTASALRESGFSVYVKCDAPVFLRMLVGTRRLHFFNHVCEIHDDDTSESPRVPLTDAEIECIADLRHLRMLNLGDTRVTDTGLECIRGMADLEVLFLDHTQITDAGLKSIHDLPSLRSLTLENTKVTGEGFQFLKNLPQLEELSLDSSPITDDALSRLTILSQMRALDLSGTEITDAGLRHLKNSRVKTLRLDHTSVSDLGLQCLEEIPELEHVTLKNTKVTAEGVETLKRALPNCRVDWPVPDDNPFDR